MSKPKHRKNQKQKSRARTLKINSQRAHFQKTMQKMMMKQIEEIRAQSSGETENKSTQDAELIQPAQEL
jgi:hypothetical protein